MSANPDKNDLVAFTRKRKLPGFFESHFFGFYSKFLKVGQVSRGYPGLAVDLERACGC